MINRDYQYTKKYTNVNEFFLPDGSVYIYGISPEERSYAIVDFLKEKFKNTKFIKIVPVDDEKDVIMINDTGNHYSLRNSNAMESLFATYESSVIYIDSSGLDNRISASLLKNVVSFSQKKQLEINVIYVEPYSYKIEQFKSEGVFNDLSEKIDEIEPLPGFANIIPDTDDMKFVALLGFEGGRFTYLLERIQPPRDRIIPVIGVPGFRFEYPFVALWGNRLPLEETNSWDNILYITSNSLVDVFFLLEKILYQTSENAKITLAPIGTKPHAIGAILFAIKHPKRVEIVYDNPKRKIIRTDGTGLIVVSNISTLLSEN
ncbi:MAG: hypothetical protein LBE13_23420 [Bacteroidales bacterium]|jgi:hypothetical protein|nr:hypothetical protein [Bacteroidales bacterium]